MKNRKPYTGDNFLSKKTLSDTKDQLESQIKRKSSANSFFKKSTELLQSYKAFFNKPPTFNFGDADTYFRQSLRNYDNFDVSKTLNWRFKQFKSSKSYEHLKLDRKTRPVSSTSSSRGDSVKPTQKRDHHTETVLKDKNLSILNESSPSLQSIYFRKEHLKGDVSQEEGEEADVEEFYSPTSLSDFEETHVQLIEKEPIIESESQQEFKMADDQLQEVENLVRQANATLNEVVAENLDFDDAMFAGEELMTMFSEGEGEEGLHAIPDIVEVEEGEASEAEVFTSVEIEAEAETAAEAEVEAEVEVEAEAEAETEAETTEQTETNQEISERETEDESMVSRSLNQDIEEKTAIGYDPNIDAAIIRELEDAETQAMETAKIIYELKERVAQLLSKPKMTEVEGKELEEKNRQLKEQMSLFETKTKRIQFLIDQASLFENMISPRPLLLDRKHNEDMLPKLIFCGITENNMPNIIVCNNKKKTKGSTQHRPNFPMPPTTNVMPKFAKRLSESYYMQERLAAENADLEGKRYKLQEDLLDKDQTVDSLRHKLNSLQGELRMVCKENCLLSEKLQRIETLPSYQVDSTCHPRSQKKTMQCGKNKGPCPADVETRLQEYSETTQQLEKQLCEMEHEVRNMQSELVAVQQERQHLEQHRRMLCIPPPCPQPPSAQMPCIQPPCSPPPCLKSGSTDQQLRELREQYNRLQDDYKSKLTEVASLRAEIEKFKQNIKDAEDSKKLAEDKMKEYEKDLKSYKLEKNKFMGSKEQLIEQEQQLNVAKQRFREAQDELEELRALIQDQQAQLDDYRNKYLQAQQQVEEQRRQIDMMEMENSHISEQVNLEIQRVKNQFQEKLQELTPLPDILKATQIKLQEAQQMHILAERNNENLIHELQAYRDKAAAMANQMEKVRSDQQLGADEKASIIQRVQDTERKLMETLEENDRLQKELVRAEEVSEQNEKRVQEKLHEIAQLVAQLETVREESARQVARTKDRCETVRRSMQNQIADLERQLAQSRAQARTAQKDRDDIRQKMQSQINNLNENFEDAQMRIRNLQGHVNFLKNSYTSVFPNDHMVGDGMDACDCGNAF